MTWRTGATLSPLADPIEARLSAAQRQGDPRTPSLLAHAFRSKLAPPGSHRRAGVHSPRTHLERRTTAYADGTDGRTKRESVKSVSFVVQQEIVRGALPQILFVRVARLIAKFPE